MNLRILSDLHFEFHRDHGAEFVRKQNSTGVDVLILAGDIFSWVNKDQRKVFSRLCEKFSQVVYVPGNHEHYFHKGDTSEYQRDLRRDIPNLHLLDASSTVIDGQRFLGGTLWFKPQPDDILFRKRYSDFDYIDKFSDWVGKENSKYYFYLSQEVGKDDIVVTHHLPSSLSIWGKFKGSLLNRFFVTEMSDLMMDKSPKLWIHGHSHGSCDYTIGDSRVVSNPMGYLHEINPMFQDDFTLQIS